MFLCQVLPCPKGKPEEHLELQTRDLQSAISGLPSQGVLVRTQAAGVCHSDLHLWHGHHKVSLSGKGFLLKYVPIIKHNHHKKNNSNLEKWSINLDHHMVL